MKNFASILGGRFWPVGHCDERPLSGIAIQWQHYVSNVDSSVEKISLEDALQNWTQSSDELKKA